MDNKPEFYKFWLGFLEKTFLILLASAFIPSLVGQIHLTIVIIGILSVFGLILLFMIVFLSWKLWSLKK